MSVSKLLMNGERYKQIFSSLSISGRTFVLNRVKISIEHSVIEIPCLNLHNPYNATFEVLRRCFRMLADILYLHILVSLIPNTIFYRSKCSPGFPSRRLHL